MKLLFKAKLVCPEQYDFQGPVINGIDTSLFTEGSQFVRSPEARAAGVYDMSLEGAELYVTLGQMVKNYQLPVSAHGWGEGDWIDAADYDPEKCFVKATNPQAAALLEAGKAETFRDTDGRWSVRMIQPAEQEPTE